MKTIAIINLGYVGDVINASPVCTEIKKHYPNSKIIFITNPTSMETARCLPHVDDVFGFDRYYDHKGVKIFNFAFQVRKQYQIDAVFILTDNFRSALLAFLMGAKKRIGRACDGRDIFITHKIPFTQEEQELKVHVTEQYMRVLKPIINYTQDYELDFKYSENDILYIDKLLSEHNLENKQLLGFCPATGSQFKNWDLKNAAEFIQQINKEGAYKIVIIGTEANKIFAEKLREIGINDFIDFSCKTTIPQLGALISKFKLFVSIDTGPMHLAFALKIPTIAMFFQPNYLKWGPSDTKKQRLIFNSNNSAISAKMVIKEMESLDF